MIKSRSSWTIDGHLLSIIQFANLVEELSLCMFLFLFLLKKLGLISFENLLKSESDIFIKCKLSSRRNFLFMAWQSFQELLFGLIIAFSSLGYFWKHLISYFRQLHLKKRYCWAKIIFRYFFVGFRVSNKGVSILFYQGISKSYFDAVDEMLFESLDNLHE